MIFYVCISGFLCSRMEDSPILLKTYLVDCNRYYNIEIKFYKDEV